MSIYQNKCANLFLALRVFFTTSFFNWHTFLDRLWGEPVNLREQHDALEFFNNLVDNLDEGLKALSGEPLFSNILGGSFADQKICKGCPHRCEFFLCFLHLFFLLYF